MWTVVRAVRDQVSLQIVKLGAPWRLVCKFSLGLVIKCYRASHHSPQSEVSLSVFLSEAANNSLNVETVGRKLCFWKVLLSVNVSSSCQEKFGLLNLMKIKLYC